MLPLLSPARLKHVLTSLATFVDLDWREGERHGAPVPDTPYRLTHLVAHDNGYGIGREVLTDHHALFATRTTRQPFKEHPLPSSLEALQRAMVIHHVQHLPSLSMIEISRHLAMLTTPEPGQLARLIAHHAQRPILVHTNLHDLLLPLFSTPQRP